VCMCVRGVCVSQFVCIAASSVIERLSEIGDRGDRGVCACVCVSVLLECVLCSTNVCACVCSYVCVCV